jgi:hypothetical protein
LNPVFNGKTVSDCSPIAGDIIRPIVLEKF